MTVSKMNMAKSQEPNFAKLILAQRQFFATGKSLEVAFRLRQLGLLRQALQEFEQPILAALNQDLGKSDFEGYATEIGMVLAEINYAIKNLAKWAKPQGARTPLSQMPAKSYVLQEPLGIVLIISPWNYPVNLALAPLVAAMAAGNCSIIKPAEDAPATALVLGEMLAKYFSPDYIAVVLGGVEVSEQLLAEEFDHIFFTGSPQVGKIVMRAAAEFLTPVTLELGGKSPCLVGSSADLNMTAKRIIWGKLINAGQTCVAPDYVLLPRESSEKFVAYLQKWALLFYGETPLTNPDYPKIVNIKHYNRLLAYLAESHQQIAFGGEVAKESLKIAPTVLLNPPLEAAVMQAEIFGPILPVVLYHDLTGALQFIKSRPKPLAFYLFSQDKQEANSIFGSLSFGGGCLNDTIVHLANAEMPFGGVGNSGMGAYHGKKGFDTFSHAKSILSRGTTVDVPVRYPPFTAKKFKLVKKLLK